MFKLFFFLFSIFLFTVNAYADESVLSSPSTQSTLLAQYNNRISVNFPLIGLSYERIKPNSYYVGIDANIFFPSFNFSDITNFEARIGYHFFDGIGHHFILTEGVGYLRNHEFLAECFSYSLEDIPEFLYESIGFSYEDEVVIHQFLVVEVGVNAQGLLAYRFPAKWNASSKEYGKITGAFPVYGFKGSLPITFRFGRQKNWDFRIQPSFLYLASHTVKMDYVYALFGSKRVNSTEKKQIQEGYIYFSIGRRF
ncbi:MAG: hypothetical protein PVI40_00505 [Chlamydiota bacterium]|jgi:hypothetical protein